MVNTRAKIKRIENTVKASFSQATMADSDHQSTVSAALIGSNDDLLTEILRRLPATSVLRFKSVSKHWLSLLSHRSFTILYDNLSSSPGLFVHKSYIPFDVENRNPPPCRILDFCLDLRGIRIVQSCNGLLLCCSDRGQEHARKYYVFNPTTKQFAIIPPVPGGQDVRESIRFMGLAFHQTDCVHYKVLCIHHPKSNWEQFQIQIYSSDTGQWKITNESFSAPYVTPFTYGVYWNRAIHWAPTSLTPLFFNLEVEQLQKLPLPSPLPERLVSSRGYRDDYLPLYFGESQGHLHLVETADGENPLHLNVYEMLTDHSGWFLKYKVELDELPAACPEMIYSYEHRSSPYYYGFKVFDVVRGEEEEEEDAFMVVRVPWKIIRYNILNKSFKQIFDMPKVLYYQTCAHMDVHRYKETLTYF